VIAVRVHTYADLFTKAGRKSRELEIAEGETLAGVLERVELGDRAVAVVNGEIGEADRVLEAGDEVHAGPGAGAPATAVLIAASVLSVAASAAISRSFANPAKTGTAEDNEERRYGFNRFSNDARAGDPIQVVYGHRPRYGGKVIARIPIEDPRGSGESRVKMLISLGHGEIDGIGNQSADFDDLDSAGLSGIFLNDQQISDFAGVRVSGRMGASSQDVIRDFGDLETLIEVGSGGSELANTSGSERTGADNAEAVSYTTSGDVDALTLRLRFPSGLYELSTGTQLEPRVLKYRFRYRVSGAGSWGDWDDRTVIQANQSEFYASPRIEFGALETYELEVQRVSVETADGETAEQDRVLLDSVIEIVDSDQSYPGTALVALEIPASEQIQTVPRVSAEVRGRKVRTYTGGGPGAPTFAVAWSNNPAEIALDLLTNAIYGLGALYGDDRIDWASWISWRDYCAETIVHPSGAETSRFGFDMVLDAQQDGTDWLGTICRAGRAVPGTVGGLWRFVVNRPQDLAVEVFTDRSIARGDSGEALITYRRELATGAVRRPNRVALQFENEQQAGQPDVATYPADGSQWFGVTANEQAREQSTRIDGVTNPDRAIAEAVYRMRRLRYQTRTVRFTTTKPVVAVQPGDRFDLASSLPGYGVASGSVLSGSSANLLRIDRTIDMQNGLPHSVRVAFADGTEETRPLVLSPTVIPAGGSFQLASPLSQVPTEGDEYAILRDGLALKPYICTGVQLEDADRLLWTIEGIEYIPGVYDPDPDAIIVLDPYSTLDDPSVPPGPVRDLRAFERLVERAVPDGNGGTSVQLVNQLELSWQQTPADAERTASFRIFRRTLGTQSWVLIPEPKISRRSAVLEIIDLNRSYQFAVVAVSVFGSALSPNDPRVPVVSIGLNSQGGILPPPANVVLSQQAGNLYTLSWDAEEGAKEYQVLALADTSGQVNAGAFDMVPIARTIETQLEDLALCPSLLNTFAVRTVSSNGRLSVSVYRDRQTPAGLASASVVSAFPVGKSLEDLAAFDLSSEGTLSNLAWSASPSFNGQTQAGRLELVSAGSPGVWTSPEVTLGSEAEYELEALIGAANDADMVALSADPLTQVPGVEADQWGIVQNDHTVGMISPPHPDTELGYLLEVRFFASSVWGSWQEWEPFAAKVATCSKYQVRATLTRARAPYRPALRSVSVVVSS
jgi:sulfur carrier protein ThiS